MKTAYRFEEIPKVWLEPHRLQTQLCPCIRREPEIIRPITCVFLFVLGRKKGKVNKNRWSQFLKILNEYIRKGFVLPNGAELIPLCHRRADGSKD
jgi:hypothetical protein